MKLYTAILAASFFVLSCATAKPTNKFRVQCIDKYVWPSGDTICVTADIDYLIQKGTGDTVLRVIKGNGIGGIAPSPSPLPDSLPKYRYIMKAEIPSGQYFASLDSIERYFMPVIGRTLTVEQAEDYKKFLSTQIFRIIQYARPDSVKIENKKP